MLASPLVGALAMVGNLEEPRSERPCSRRGGGGVERGGDPWVALGGRTLPSGWAMQASPPRSTPPPPLRDWMHLKTLHKGIHKKPTLVVARWVMGITSRSCLMHSQCYLPPESLMERIAWLRTLQSSLVAMYMDPRNAGRSSSMQP